MSAIPQPSYCPICGETLIERQINDRMRPACEACGYVHFVNPVPGVGLIIEHKGKIVLVRRGSKVHSGRWALPSGYIEADESVEGAAIREGHEETGLDLELLEFFGVYSFPEGPPASGIIIFFRARPIGGSLKAGDDAKDVALFTPQELPPLPFRTHRQAMSRWLRLYKDRHEQQGASIPAFTIRLAENNDADDIVQLLRADLTPDQAKRVDWRAVSQRFRESASLQVFVAEANQSPHLIVGFVALSLVRTLTGAKGWIDDMAFDPHYANESVGVALLEAAMRRGRRLNLTHLYVNTARGNASAREFYQIVGFRPSTINYLRIR